MPAPMPLGSLLNAPDYADRVNLIKKIKTANGWCFAPVVPELNGRLKDRVSINGQVEVHPEGGYYSGLDSLRDGATTRQSDIDGPA
jgi:integrase/recombinase XerD